MFPVDINPCHALSAILSQMFAPRDPSWKSVACQDFASALQTDDSRSMTNPPYVVTLL
jgi:hypothetical protein